MVYARSNVACDEWANLLKRHPLLNGVPIVSNRLEISRRHIKEKNITHCDFGLRLPYNSVYFFALPLARSIGYFFALSSIFSNAAVARSTPSLSDRLTRYKKTSAISSRTFARSLSDSFSDCSAVSH